MPSIDRTVVAMQEHMLLLLIRLMGEFGPSWHGPPPTKKMHCAHPGILASFTIEVENETLYPAAEDSYPLGATAYQAVMNRRTSICA